MDVVIVVIERPQVTSRSCQLSRVRDVYFRDLLPHHWHTGLHRTGPPRSGLDMHSLHSLTTYDVRTWVSYRVTSTARPLMSVTVARRFSEGPRAGSAWGRGSRYALQTFPGQVRPILRNFHVHNVCKYHHYRPSHTIRRNTERLLMCSRRWPRTVKKTGHSVHQLTSPHKHTDFINATAVSL